MLGEGSGWDLVVHPASAADFLFLENWETCELRDWTTRGVKLCYKFICIMQLNVKSTHIKSIVCQNCWQGPMSSTKIILTLACYHCCNFMWRYCFLEKRVVQIWALLQGCPGPCRAMIWWIRAVPNMSAPCPHDPCRAKYFRAVPS